MKSLTMIWGIPGDDTDGPKPMPGLLEYLNAAVWHRI
jgi:hypothetical protein